MRAHTRRKSVGAGATRAAAAAALLLLLLLCPAPSDAQATSGRRDERRADLEERQRALRSLSGMNDKPAKKAPDRRPAYREVAEDFEQLQLRNYRLSGVLEPGSELDYKLIREEAAEVRRRASRLKATLALPAARRGQPQKKGDEPLTPGAMRAAILSLDSLVKGFAWNPVFQNPDVLDAENSAKAGRDLEEILRLSEQIRAAADSLGRGKKN